MDITAKTKTHDAVTVQYNIPETLPELVATFGEAIVAGAAVDALVIGVQAFVRRHIDKPQAELQGLVDGYKPGVRQPAVKQTAAEKAQSAIGQMSDEERRELLNKLKAQLKGA